jgi:hypothetical protein
MNDLAIHSPSQSNASPLTIELAKMLGLVAPVTMSADQCTVWLASAEDALKGIRANEVTAVSMEVRRTVTRPSQIVPEIAKLVAERRSEQSRLDRLRAEDEASRLLPPPRKHIMDRDRRNFVAADWAELNEYLEKNGSPVRYGSDGTKIAT